MNDWDHIGLKLWDGLLVKCKKIKLLFPNFVYNITSMKRKKEKQSVHCAGLSDIQGACQ